MIIYPAIDIKENQCVRLLQGRMEDVTVFGTDPGAMARRWKGQGAQWIHVVDLDGAFAGQSVNLPAIRDIVEAGVPVQLGGGIRRMEQITQLLEQVGVARVILGTAALEQPALVKAAAARYGTRIAVGIDAKAGKVAVRGWARTSDVTAVDLGLAMADMGIRTLIYTDIARDGMMIGPNFDASAEMIGRTGLDVIISGGVAGLEDVKKSARLGAAGVILGRALYSGAIELKEALKEAAWHR